MSKIGAEKRKVNASGKWVAILIHGTWARDAAWTQRDSLLRLKLETLFSCNNISFDQFKWNGNNLFALRKRESIKLSSKLKALLENSNDNIALFCHSHGGNIATNAIDKIDVDSDRIRLVLFNTPALYFLRRDGGIFFSNATLLLMIFFIIWFVISIMEALEGGIDVIFSNSVSMVLVGFSFLSMIATMLCFYFRRSIVGIGIRWVEKTELAVQNHRITNAKILSINTAGDEVFNLFKTLESISSIPFIILNRTIFIIVLCSSLYFLVDYAFTICNDNIANEANTIGFKLLCNSARNGETARLVLNVLLVLSIISIVLLFSLTLISFFLNGLFCIFLGINPLTGPIKLFFHRIGVSVVQLSATKQEFLDAGVSGTALNHSVAYSDPHVIEYIYDWLIDNPKRLSKSIEELSK